MGRELARVPPYARRFRAPGPSLVSDRHRLVFHLAAGSRGPSPLRQAPARFVNPAAGLFKRTGISFGGGALITVALYVFYLAVWRLRLLIMIAKTLLWPIAACMYLAGPGPPIGPPQRNINDGSPHTIWAFLVGVVGTGFFS